MKRSRSFLLFVGLSIALCSACDMHNNANMNANTSAKKMTDSELETAVKTKLDADAQLRAADLDVDADAADNRVTLSGTVMSQELRAKAVDTAKTAHSGVVVNDKITVKPTETSRENYTEGMAKEARDKARQAGDAIGNSLDDAWIHTKITAKLIGDSATPARKINVDVNNNVVTLRGTVDTAEAKTEAERIAKSTDGVKQVINQLKVAKV